MLGNNLAQHIFTSLTWGHFCFLFLSNNILFQCMQRRTISPGSTRKWAVMTLVKVRLELRRKSAETVETAPLFCCGRIHNTQDKLSAKISTYVLSFSPYGYSQKFHRNPRKSYRHLINKLSIDYRIHKNTWIWNQNGLWRLSILIYQLGNFHNVNHTA